MTMVNEPIPQNILYWHRNNFMLNRIFYINDGEPAHFRYNDLQEELDHLVNTIQAFGIHTVYVDLESDLAFLEYIKTQLAKKYDYHHDLKMEVKPK